MDDSTIKFATWHRRRLRLNFSTWIKHPKSQETSSLGALILLGYYPKVRVKHRAAEWFDKLDQFRTWYLALRTEVAFS